eukprot:9754817-Alexandrium_andersonii.AAC.1
MASLESWDDVALEGSDSEPSERRPKRRRCRSKTSPTSLQVARRRSDVRGEKLGLPGVCYRRLLKMKLPIWFFGILWAAARENLNQPALHCVEYYAGAGAVQ